MFRKINQYLLLHHPLLWNMRLVQVFTFALICHSLFFFLGYFSVSGISVFKSYEYAGLEHFQIFLFGGLILLIGLIGWLVVYLRHNAFKSFFPSNPQRLRKEFILVFLVFLINFPIFHTYLYARHLKLLKISAHLNPVEDAQIVNIANCFIPVSHNKYDSENCCDSINARAAREALIPVIDNNYCSAVTDETGEEITTETIKASAEAAVETMPDGYSKASSSPTYSEYLYGNYCQKTVEMVDYKSDAQDYHRISKRWLDHNERDSIKQCLLAYFKIMDKYQARHSVNIDTLVAWCFLDKKHTVYHEVNSYYENLSSAQFTNIKLNYMEGEFDALPTSISNVHNEQTNSQFSLPKLITYIYVAFGFSLVLILFRFTRLKPWISAIIGLGIWGIIFGLIAIVFEENTQYILLLFVLITLIFSTRYILGKRNKLASGLALHWFAYSFLSLVPIVMEVIYQSTGEINQCINNHWVLIRPAFPINTWIKFHWDEIFLLNGVLGFLIVLWVIIPLCFRWQANPSE